MSQSEEQQLTERGQTANNKQTDLPGNVQPTERIVMNSKLIYTATLAVALLGGGAAMASEATQFGIDPSTASRAEVKAELERAQGAGEFKQATQAYGGFVTPLGSQRSRAEVRDEARTEARSRSGGTETQYTGS